MEVKFKDNPVTIKTVEIGGKKLTKQFLQQIPLKERYLKKKGHSPDSYSPKDIKGNEDLKDYIFDCYSIVGYINIILEKEDEVILLLYSGGIRRYCSAYTILYVNNSGELERCYMSIKMYNELFGKEFPQIYV